MNWEVDPESGTVFGSDPDVCCGFELGDWYSFTSLNSGEFSAARTLRHYDCSESTYRAKHEVSLHSGSAVVTQSEEFLDDGINREVELQPTSSTDIGDLVLRFVFDAQSFPVAKIANRTFEHQGKNRYLQFNVTEARLIGEQGTVSIESSVLSLPDSMDLVMYIRDQPPEQWIIHIRALARHSEKGFVRLYNHSVTRLPILDAFVRLFGLTRFLRYCREYGTRVRYLPDALPFQYVEYVELDPDDVLAIRAEYRFDSETSIPKNNVGTT